MLIFSKPDFLRSIVLMVTIVILTACSQSNTTVFINGDIITVNAAQPDPEALAIRDGVIIAVGDEKEVRAIAGKSAEIRDLSGQTMIPGLIDAHGHFGMGSFVKAMADLQPPPAGPVNNFDDLTAALINWRGANPKADWILGVGYDDSLLAEGRHPTRDDLDKVSSDTPIMIMHVSGHLLSCNTPCLAAAGIGPDTKPPAGGVIRRRAGSDEPDGVLEETAMQLAMAQMPLPSALQALDALKQNQIYYASQGITTAQDGAASSEIIKALQGMAAIGQLKLDVVAYPAIRAVDDFDDTIVTSADYKKHFRVGGVKLILDGSPQGKTAWLTHPYHIVPDGSPEDYVGYPIMDTKDVETIITKAFDRDVQVIAHANGDAAADQLLGVIKNANDSLGRADRRSVMIHAQTARDDQIALMKSEGVIPSYFVAHTFFWGDWHRDSVFGPERAERISPLQMTIDMAVPYTIHNDSPVVPPDMMRLMWTAVNRETRSGQTLGPDQRVTPIEALKAVTINAAYQYIEENRKGSLEVGKLADMVILSDNPLTVPPGAIKDIQVVETIKDGHTVFVTD